MKKRIIILLGFVVFLSMGCADRRMDELADQTEIAPETDNLQILPGIIRVKLTRAAGDNFSVGEGGDNSLRSGRPDIDRFLRQVGATKMTRVFRPAGKYEERSRREGLHLWYDVIFDEKIPVTRAASEMKVIPGVEIIEKLHRIEPTDSRPVLFAVNPPVRTDKQPFNDPQLGAQWHYNNVGRHVQSVEGADINLFEAWKVETGKKNVIVSVVDGGVDYRHEDLRENMYVNLAELNGEPGKDNDNNGYKNDVYGYNFVLNNGVIEPVRHGTHVAGTVAARNGNGKGVCGVAGGNGEPDSGVRIMTCQVFLQNGWSASSFAEAIKYGADNGAVISQNSWGYNYPGPDNISPSLKEAIDYFIKYAGCDENGNQLEDSPMKGGIVVFAAGNDGRDFKCFPAAYPKTISVASMAPDYTAAYYSNCGDWVTLTAPGGSRFYSKGEVLSTLPGNTYGYMQGTSMACPHVSGIAALVVSRFGGPGFTSQDLEKRLRNSFLPVDIDEMNPKYRGRLGRGYIDAAKALAENRHKKPEKVAKAEYTAKQTELALSWAAVKDEDDVSASLYYVYLSEHPLNEKNFRNARKTEVKAWGRKPGDPVEVTLNKLKKDTKYFLAIEAVDRWEEVSGVYLMEAKTTNSTPVVLKLDTDKPVRVSGLKTTRVKLLVEDADRLGWSYTVSGNTEGVKISKEENGLLLEFKAVSAVGKYTLTVSVCNAFSDVTEMDIPFEVYRNQAPALTRDPGRLFVTVNTVNGIELDLSKYFEDKDGDKISYTVHEFTPSVAKAVVNGNVLTVKPVKTGIASFELTATDESGAHTTHIIPAQVVEDKLVYAIYPVPTVKVLHVRLSDKVNRATVSILTPTGTRIKRQEVSIETPEQRHLQLDVSKLAGGTYFLQVEAQSQTDKQPFVKQ
ncbi:hypothetical protein HR11_02725 [Porphyromonas macacae]|uniref:S8 family serine peptidase n=1 Tax=Porphyromonas macacae TaxID=28115 RepID=UPI00052D9230|nr:S8 family serine peptidase [Porphyromonas macacae]KGN99221.1 hypothetical protein HR11_02725 [Porphyromonas macacae]